MGAALRSAVAAASGLDNEPQGWRLRNGDAVSFGFQLAHLSGDVDLSDFLALPKQATIYFQPLSHLLGDLFCRCGFASV